MTRKPARARSLMLSISEAADLLGIHPSTAYRAIAAGTFPVPVVRIGDVLKVPRAAVHRLGAQASFLAATADTADQGALSCFVCGAPVSRLPR